MDGAGLDEPGDVRRLPRHDDPVRRVPVDHAPTSATVSASSLSWVLNAYTIVFAALLIPAGRLADRVGRRRTFLTAVVMFTLASMLCGLAPTAGFLVAARVLQAVGAAALVPSSLALVLQTFPSEKIPVAVAHLGRDRRGRGRLRPHARRARRRELRLAVGVLHQPAGRHRQLRARPARPARRPGGEPRPAARSARRRRCSPAGLALAGSPS